MLYYIVPYIYILFFSLNIYFSKRVKKVNFKILFLLIFPAFLVAILRGNIGTDTIQYLNYFKVAKIYGRITSNIEPGFVFLEWVVAILKLSERIAVAFISVFTTFFLCKSFSKSKLEMLLFTVVLFPIFYVDMTMNGIRYGLSFSIALIAIDLLFKKKYIPFAIWGIVAVSIHFSTLIMFAVFLFDLLKKKYLFILFFFLSIILIFSGNTFNFLFDHIAGKEDAYRGLYSPSILSGIGPLSLFVFLYISFLVHSKKKSYSNCIHVIFLLEIISFVIARYSYAGLRLQSEILFILIIYIKGYLDCIIRKRSFILKLVLIGILGFIIVVKNINVPVEDGAAPFLPYKFYWQTPTF